MAKKSRAEPREHRPRLGVLTGERLIGDTGEGQSDLAAKGLGVTVFGQTMTIGEEGLVVGPLGSVLLAAAVWKFSRTG
jgi:hypothetical protein